ncbi:hypothetical protein [Nonomuraea jabiensis]|uniref:Uncharacterized protein n=1 Tax=Nonomuraea jabiensis TaxID=882448 RepID=A0A7W9GDC2_9ACTN|nr:hypothetical protein [Nonomuraea jabiensis]MBB5781714.1 hypothetical protein [Nonomuraea jabiensis]
MADDRRKLELAQRRSQALQMRIAGVSPTLIAERLGYNSPQAASGDVTAALKRAAKVEGLAAEHLLAFMVTIPALGLTETAAGYVSTIGSGVLALIVALQTRPWVISTLTGAVSTILTGLSHFWLVLTPAQTAAFILPLPAVLGLVLRGQVSPKSGPVAHVVVVEESCRDRVPLLLRCGVPRGSHGDEDLHRGRVAADAQPAPPEAGHRLAVGPY